MGRKVNNLLLAAAVSVGVHALTVSVGFRHVFVGGWTEVAPRPLEMEIAFADIPPPEAPPAQPPPPPAPEPKREELDLGDADGVGYASHAADGPREQTAREADADQAALSRDGRGVGRGGASPLPRSTVLAQGGSASRPETAAMARATPPAPAPPAPPAVPSVQLPLPAPLDAPPAAAEESGETGPQLSRSPADDSNGGPASPVARAADDAVASAEPPPVALAVRDRESDRPARRDAPPPRPPVVTPPAPSRAPAVAGQAGASADPAPQSDSESDPFAKLGSADFREGSLAVRFGRKVKTRKPKLGLKGKVDLFQMQGAKIVLNIAVDARGHVTSAEVATSSGSADIDQPTRVAMYEWWFEPKKDKAGQPVPDNFQFTINWR